MKKKEKCVPFPPLTLIKTPKQKIPSRAVIEDDPEAVEWLREGLEAASIDEELFWMFYDHPEKSYLPEPPTPDLLAHLRLVVARIMKFREHMALSIMGWGMSQASASSCAFRDYLSAAADGLPASLLPYVATERPVHRDPRSGTGKSAAADDAAKRKWRSASCDARV